MIIDLFGYQFMILKKRKVPTIETAYKIASDGRFLLLCNKDGDTLPGQLSCTLHERINQPPYAAIELIVNIDELLEKGKTINY